MNLKIVELVFVEAQCALKLLLEYDYLLLTSLHMSTCNTKTD